MIYSNDKVSVCLWNFYDDKDQSCIKEITILIKYFTKGHFVKLKFIFKV